MDTLVPLLETSAVTKAQGRSIRALTVGKPSFAAAAVLASLDYRTPAYFSIAQCSVPMILCAVPMKLLGPGNA